MEHIPEAAQPVGRARRGAGLMILALGTLIWVRVAWLVVFYGAGFRREEWIRSVFWVWLGAVLGLTGCWLRYRSRSAGWPAAIAVPALFGLLYLADRLAL